MNWSDRKPNDKFPACATVARQLLAEVYGCRPGEKIPSEEELLTRGQETAMAGRHGAIDSPYPVAVHVNGGWHDYGVQPREDASLEDAAKAQTALNMADEIGGLFASVEDETSGDTR